MRIDVAQASPTLCSCGCLRCTCSQLCACACAVASPPAPPAHPPAPPLATHQRVPHTHLHHHLYEGARVQCRNYNRLACTADHRFMLPLLSTCVWGGGAAGRRA